MTDVAKLANCGFDAKHSNDTQYLKLWGEWMRAQLAVIRQSPKDGYFSGACLEHGGVLAPATHTRTHAHTRRRLWLWLWLWLCSAVRLFGLCPSESA